MKRPQVSAASRRSLFLGTARFHKFCGHAASLEARSSLSRTDQECEQTNNARDSSAVPLPRDGSFRICHHTPTAASAGL
jgi:hypothetical protein